MKIEIKFTEQEAQALKWLLAQKYGKGNASFSALAKIAIREAAAEQAQTHLTSIPSRITTTAVNQPTTELL